MCCAITSACKAPASVADLVNVGPAPSILTAPLLRSCITPLTTVNEKQKMVTLEGLGSPQKPHPVQKAFIDEQAAQCGYCINGMIMESAAFLTKNKKPSEADIKNALANNLCRCGTHARIVRAVKRASAQA
jgi:nicotinate dehydrogenase subunit A